MVEFDFELVGNVATLVLAILAVYAGSYLAKAKEKLHAVRVLADDLDNALADNVLSKEEVERIASDIHQILGTPIGK